MAQRTKTAMPVSANNPKSARSTEPGDGMLDDGHEEGDGAAHPRKTIIAHAATRAALLTASSVVAFIRTPRYSSAGGASRSNESIASWTALTSKVLDVTSMSEARQTAWRTRTARCA